MFTDIELVSPEFTARNFPVTLPVMRRANIYGERYYYKLLRGSADGSQPDTVKLYNSVTSLVHKVVGDKQQLIRWAADKGAAYSEEMQKSAAYGTLVHTFLLNMFTNKVDVDSMAEAYVGRAQSLKDAKERTYLLQSQASLQPKLAKDLYSIHCLLHDIAAEPLAVELILSNDSLGVAGALDLVCYVDFGQGKELAILDLKTGCRTGEFYKDYQIQLGIYALMWNSTPELVAAYGAVKHIGNFSPKDFPTSARTFYNLKLWDFEQTITETEAYLMIWQSNYEADQGGAAMAAKKQQIFTGSFGALGECQRLIVTVADHLAAIHKADFQTLPFAPAAKPYEVTAEDQGKATEFLSFAGQDKEAVKAILRDAAKSPEPQGTFPDAVGDVKYNCSLPMPELTSKGRPPAEYTATKEYNKLVEGGVTAARLLAMQKSQPRTTKVQQLIGQMLDMAVTDCRQQPLPLDGDSQQQPPAKDLGAVGTVTEAQETATELETMDFDTVKPVEDQAEGLSKPALLTFEVNSEGDSPKPTGAAIYTAKPAYEPAGSPALTISTDDKGRVTVTARGTLREQTHEDLDRQAAAEENKAPAKPAAPEIPTSVALEIQRGLGYELAKKRLGQVNEKLHELTRQGAAGTITPEQYDTDLKKLTAIRKAYLAVIDEYKAKGADDPPPF